MARKEKYNTHVKPYLKDIVKWIKEGETEYCIVEKLGIDDSTWYKYKNKYIELTEAIKKGEQNLILHIESALYKRCFGEEVEETKTYIEKFGDKEKKKVEKIKRRIASSDTALIFALKNLSPEKWKDRQEFKQNINQKIENIVIDIDDEEMED